MTHDPSVLRRTRTMRALSILGVVATFGAACDDGGGGSGGAGSGGSNTTSSSSTTGASTSSTSGSTGSATTSTTTGSAMTSGSTGSGGACTPGETQPCYTGPAPTKNVGACKEGVSTCDASGVFGACVGEVLPTTETCATPVDDDCNGQTNESGAQCVCVPNSMASCYTGPQGTMGVGACAAGTALCDDQGLVLGPCTGEILPTAENCIAAPDEDCNGVAATCTGNSLWTKGFGDPSAQRVRGVALVQGGPVITGTFAGAVNFGGGALTSIGANGDLFVARYDALGNHLWSRRFGDASAQTGVSVAVTPQNEVVVVGDFAGTLVLGGATLTSLGQTDVFVAKFDAGGNPIWARAFGDPSAQTAGGVAIGPSGEILVTGTFAGTISTTAGTLTSAGGTDVFLLALDSATGAPMMAQRFGGAGAQVGVSVAASPAGIALAIGNSGTTSVGGSVLSTSGGSDVVLARLDLNLTPMFAASFGDASNQAPTDVAIDDAGEIVATGTFAGSMNFGGTMLSSGGTSSMFLARLSANGTPLWAKAFGGSQVADARAVALDPFGGILLTGAYSGVVDFGGGPFLAVSGLDAVVAKYDALGNHVWSRHAGSMLGQTGEDIVGDATAVYVAGTFETFIDFGSGQVNSAGGNDIFLAALAP